MAKNLKHDNDFAMKFLSNLTIQDGDLEIPPCIPTGHFHLDFAIRYGLNPNNVDLDQLHYDPKVPLGLPLGKVIEFFGAEGGGKSSLAYRVAGNAHQMGFNVAWIDAEQSYSKDLALINGCDLDKMLVIKTSENDLFAEKVLDVMEALCLAEKVPQTKNGKVCQVDAPKVIILDSLASIVPKQVEENSAENQNVALLARLLSQNLGKIVKAADKNQVMVIFINQLRIEVGKMFGDDETSPGGKTPKHACSLRLKITKSTSKDGLVTRSTDEGDEKIVGRNSYVQIKKNRFGPPYEGSIHIPIYYERYFPDLEEIIFDTGRQMKLISVRNGVYSWQNLKSEGRSQFISDLREKKMVSKLVEDIKAIASEQHIILPPEILLMSEVKDDNEETREVPRAGETKDSESGEANAKKRRGKKGS